MPQFRIALGYKTPHRKSEPVILAASYSPEVIQEAINRSGPEIERVEVGAFHFIRRGKKHSGGKTPSGSRLAEPGGDLPSSADLLPPPADAALGEDDDGPVLDIPKPKPKR
jgi:hypothetical protein